MQFNTVKVLRESPGITTTLAVSADDRELVVRRLDLSRTRPWSRRWLEGEVETIRRTRLPHVVAVTIADRGLDHLDLVRPFVEGLDIREWFARQPPPSLVEQLRVMSTLFYPLARLHSLGIAHGGVTPANIVLTGRGDLVLLDVGVSRAQLAARDGWTDRADVDNQRSDQPHQHLDVGFTADLFAAGLVLLESVAQVNRTASVLRRMHPSAEGLGDPAQLLDLVRVPSPLRPVFARLLDPVPAMRFQTAEEVLGELEALLATSTKLEPGAGVPQGSGASTSAPAPPPVGRYHELAALISGAEGAEHGSGSTICLSGESGLGKTHLLDAVTEHAAGRGTTVLRTGAFDQAPTRPLGPFGGVFRDVVAHLGAHPDGVVRVRDDLGDLLPVVLDQVPEFAAAFAGAPAAREPGPVLLDAPAQVVPAAIARLLVAAFGPEDAGLIVLDDGQWADDLTWQVLEKLAETIGARAPTGAASITLVISCRPEAVARVREWGVAQVEYVGLSPLSEVDTEQLIRSVDASVPADVIPYVAKLSRGNPLDALLICQGLMDSSFLSGASAGWTADERADGGEPAPLDARRSSPERGAPEVLVSTWLSSLSPPTAEALHQAAVIGRRFSAGLLAAALSVSASAVEQRLDEAVRRGIVRGVPGGDRGELEFAHDRLRDAVLRALDEGGRQALHLRAARALQRRGTSRADYDIAYHYARAGHPAEALDYALRAGEAGLRHHALDVAEINFAIAEAGLASSDLGVDDGLGFRVYEGLGTVHMLRGNYDLAAKELVRAHDLSRTQTATDSVPIATLLSELAFKTGRFDDAAQWRQRSLEDLALPVPRHAWHAGVSVLYELVLLAGGWLVRPLRAGRSARRYVDSERRRLAARTYNRLVYEWWFIRSPVWVVWAILRGARFANAAGSTRERAQALSTAAVLSGTAPILAPIALRLINRSLRLRERAGDGWGLAQSHHFRGFVLYAANRYREAIEAFDTAITAFDVLGDRWEQVAAMWQKALCFGRLGLLNDAGTLARYTYREAKRRGDLIGAGTALAIWASYLPGDVAIETLMREINETDPGDRHTLALLQASRAQRLAHAEHYEQALDAARQADELLRASGIRNHFLAPILTSHLQILRMSLPAGASWWTEERRLQTRTSRRILRRARRSALVFSGERPAAWREWALMAFASGHRLLGSVVLRAAARSARRHAAQGELAACALVASLAGVTPRRGALAGISVPETVRELGISVDRGIVEAGSAHEPFAGTSSTRHHALLDAVSSLVAADEVAEVLDKLRDAVFATTTARRVEFTRNETEVEQREPGTAPESAEMHVTERLVMPVGSDGEAEVSVVAAFPLGEGEQHAPTMEVLAAVAGGVIEREILRRESMERMVAVQEAERGRIARDLHDEFSHLFATAMGGLSTLQDSSDPAVRETATEVREIVRQGITVARSVAWSLRPSGLDDLGLVGSIEQYVEDFRERFPIRVDLTTTGHVPALSPAVETAVFRIVQEALTNIARHSGAREASVMLVGSTDSLRAVVEDNGIGFDVELADQRKSLGLIGARERTRLVGGRLSIESSPNQGTTIMAEVPVKS
ncbi:AAA family ATPase [Streptomyces sp. GC420]|uniref:AAA family ATPase n=1 Tax=Streptomyces sp. GC420 TaxID=2697568 RepID=UPI001415258C|nr:AAA family ATPase [Streptomyces sp. GC420]NBM14230.1 AAA family ATPase [Streptomyces sp. GC420]